MTYDLAIEGGTLVTPRGRARLNVYVQGERIAEVTDARRPARETFDAGGLLVMPGMVDSHVHLMDPGATSREDFPTGTAAAARSGVTTIVEHTHASPVRTVAEMHAKLDHLRERSRVDYGLAAHAWPDRIDEVPALWAAGVVFFKVFTCTTHGVPGFDAGHLRRLFERIAAANAICLVHCEDETITAEAERILRETGRKDNGVIPEWRNRDAELTALAVTALLARRAGARIVTAHVSHPDALAAVARERAAGAAVRIESCPQYLSLREDEIIDHGALRKFTPPARARSEAELDRMWASLSDGGIDIISTDHAPSTADQKREGDIWETHFGLPGLDTTLAVLLDGAARGRLSYERITEAYAETPARTYGLWPRKGRLGVDADADVVVVDPDERWTVSDADIISKAGWSPYAGRTLTGRAVRTYLRGRLIADGGSVIAEPGSGRHLRGPGVAGGVQEGDRRG
jgi:allantoinase